MLPMRRAGTSARPGRSSENHAGDGEIPIPLGVADRQQQSELRLFVPRELNGFSGRPPDSPPTTFSNCHPAGLRHRQSLVY